MYNEISRTITKDQHLLEGETLEDGLKRTCEAYGTDEEHSNRLYEYVSKQWFFFASPVLANGGTSRGLPISCYLNHVPDSRKGILEHYTENGWLTSMGGGIGGSWNSVRSIGQKTSRGLKTTGLVPFMHVVDSQMLAFSQGSTRRGAYAAYLDISHPEVLDFINMRKPSGGDPNRRNLNLHHGLNITDDFMKAVTNDGSWDLVDPHTGRICEVLKARALWATIIDTRLQTGEPYLAFIDEANRKLPQDQRLKGLRINGSNLCNEIWLPTNEERSAVCCLSSLNAAKYDEWSGNEQFVCDMVEMLDNVLTDFIERAETFSPEFKKAVYSATQERSIGLGLMGLHTFLQTKMIPYDCAMGVAYSRNISKFIFEVATKHTKHLANIRGAAPDSSGNRRNMHLIAIAPNATSSLVCNQVSPSIELIAGNSFTKKAKTLNFTWTNEALYKHIGTPEENPKVWKSIHANNGSVQHLDIPQDVKDVFKTAFEIDQNWVIEHAAKRQEFIDQGQSVNIYFNNTDKIKYISDVHMKAWKSGLKGLYYVRTNSVRRPENITQSVERNRGPVTGEECIACEG